MATKITARGDKIIVEIDATKAEIEAAPPSSTGKNMLLATVKDSVLVNGKKITIGLNAYFPKG